MAIQEHVLAGFILFLVRGLTTWILSTGMIRTSELLGLSRSGWEKTPLSATTPQSGSLAEMGGKLYQQPTCANGSSNTFQSDLPFSFGYSAGTYPAPVPMTLQVNVFDQGPTQFVAGQVLTPEFV